MLQLIKRLASFLRWDGRTVLSTLLSLGGLSAIHPAVATAADRLTLYYSSLQFSLSIDTLETYAETGEITSEFTPYARFLDEPQLVQLRQVLQQRIDEKSPLVAHFTYMDMGDYLSATYAQTISQDQPRLYLIQELTQDLSSP